MHVSVRHGVSAGEPGGVRGAWELEGLLAVTVLGSVLAIGSVMTWARLSLGVLAVCMAVACVVTKRGVVTRVRLPVYVLTALAVWTALSALPIPVTWLERLSPQTAVIWLDAFRLVGEPAPNVAALSLDPGASIREALLLAVYAAVLIAAADVGLRRGTRAVALSVLVAGVVVSVVTLAHGIVGAERLYGVYEPTVGIGTWHLAPLLNANNLAGYLALSGCAGLGLVLLRRPPAPRGILIGASVVVLTAFSVAASRAGIIAFLVGLLVLGAGFGRFSRRRGGVVSARRALGLFGAVALLSLVAGVLAMGSRAVAEVSEWGADKVELWWVWWPMIEDFWSLGIGRGAFESVSPAYARGQGDTVFSHPENVLIQLGAEWGVVLGAVVLLVLAYGFRPRVLGASRRFSAVGLLAGAVALVVHNLADLSLEVPAVAILLLAALGGSAGGAARGERPLPQRRIPVVVGGVALACLAAALVWGRRSLADDRQRIESSVASTDVRDRAARTALEDEIERAVLRHPADPYFYRAAALMAWLGRERQPLVWLGAALRRGPESSRSHFLLARVLAERGVTHQALLELRLAVGYDARLSSRAARLATRLTDEPELLARIAPDGIRGTEVLLALAEALPKADAAGRAELLRQAVRRSDGRERARVALARQLLEAVGSKASPCAGERRSCLDEVDQLLGDADDSSWLSLVARAERDLAMGAAAAAEQRLAEECSRFSNRGLACFELRLRAAAATESRPRLVRAARVFLAHACAEATSCDAALETVARTAGEAGFPGLALRYRTRWAKAAPDVARWLSVAEAARALGDRAEAIRALQRAEALAAPSERAAIEAERARSVRPKLGSP